MRWKVAKVQMCSNCRTTSTTTVIMQQWRRLVRFNEDDDMATAMKVTAKCLSTEAIQSTCATLLWDTFRKCVWCCRHKIDGINVWSETVSPLMPVRIWCHCNSLHILFAEFNFVFLPWIRLHHTCDDDENSADVLKLLLAWIYAIKETEPCRNKNKIKTNTQNPFDDVFCRSRSSPRHFILFLSLAEDVYANREFRCGNVNDMCM